MAALTLFVAASLAPSNAGKAIITLLAGIFLVWWLAHRPWVWHPLDVPILGLLGTALVSTMTAHFVGRLGATAAYDKLAHLTAFEPSLDRADGYVIWLCYGLAALVAQRLMHEESTRMLMRMWWIALVIGFVALLQGFGGGGIDLTRLVGNGGLPRETRSFGTLGNPIFLGVWAALWLPMVGLWQGSAMLVTAVLAASWTRSAWLGAGIGLAILRPPLRTIIALSGVFVVTVILTGFGHSNIQHLLDDTSVVGRMQLWQETTRLIAARPLFGYGTGTMELGSVLSLPQMPIGQKLDNPHNELLYVAYSFGIVGLMWYLGVWFAAMALPNLPSSLAAGLIGAFVALQFNWSHIGVANWLWAMLGLTVPLSAWTPDAWTGFRRALKRMQRDIIREVHNAGPR